MEKIGRTPLTPQQLGVIKEMVRTKNASGAITAALGLKKKTVAYNAAIIRRGGGGQRDNDIGPPKVLSPCELPVVCLAHRRLVLRGPSGDAVLSGVRAPSSDHPLIQYNVQQPNCASSGRKYSHVAHVACFFLVGHRCFALV